MAKKPIAKRGMAPADALDPKPQVPATQQAGGLVKKEDLQGMVLVGDKHDLSHIKQTNRGSENVAVEDLVIPRLEIVQGMSAAVKPNDPGYIEGAKQGDLINSVTRQVYGREVMIVFVHYVKQWLVWKDYNHGGGFFGAFPNPQEANARADEEGGKAQHIEVIDTPMHLALLVNFHAGRIDEVMIPMAKTKAKVSRTLNTMIRMSGKDRFACVYRITTAIEKNNKGQEYWNYVVAQAGAPNPKLYAFAEKLFNEVTAGKKSMVMDTKNMGGEPEGPGGDAEM